MWLTSATREHICRYSPTTTRPRLAWSRRLLRAPRRYQNRRPVPTFGDIEIAYGGNSSSYNSLQVKLEKRVGALYVLNSFTYSRTFDLASGHLETSNGDNSRVNFANPRNDYGPSGYDQPLADTTSIVYDLPYGHGRHFGNNSSFLLNELLGGWQLTTINTMPADCRST